MSQAYDWLCSVYGLAWASISVTVLYALWASQAERTAIEDGLRAKASRRALGAFCLAFILQIFFLALIRCSIPNDGLHWAGFGYIGIIVIHLGIHELLENRIQGLARKVGDLRRLILKGVVVLAVSCIALWAALDGGDGPVLATVVFFVIVFSLSAVQKRLLGARKVEDPEALAVLNRTFLKVQMKNLGFYSYTTKKSAVYQPPFFCGLGIGEGTFRRALFFSDSLLRELSLSEFEAMMIQTASRVQLRRRPRMLFEVFLLISFSLALLILFFVVQSAMALHGYWPALLALPGKGAIPVLVVCILQIHMQLNSIRHQEFEIDENAVSKLGAPSEAYASALRKILSWKSAARPWDWNQGRKAAWIETRVTVLEKCLERIARGERAFTFRDRIKAFFGDGVAGVVALSLLAALFVGLPFSIRSLSAWRDLTHASCKGDVAGIERALRAGIDPNGGDGLLTQDPPLLYAASCGHVEAVRYLQAHGARWEPRAFCGNTLLHLAAKNGHLDLLKDLLANNGEAEPLRRMNSQGETALRLAQLGKHAKVVKYLLTQRQRMPASRTAGVKWSTPNGADTRNDTDTKNGKSISNAAETRAPQAPRVGR